MRVAVIGLGAMGAAAAGNLLRKGHEVRGVDVRREALEALRSAGGIAHESITAAVQGAEAIVTFVVNAQQVDAVVLGEGGVAQAMEPDAVVVQTHRDPLKVIASVSALAAHLRRMASDDTSVVDAAAEFADVICLGLERGMAARDDGTVPPDRVVDVHFADFVADPMRTIAALYARLGMALTPATDARMRAFLAANPGDGGGGRYTFADTGLDAGALRERVRPYQERFGVASEPVR